MKDIFTDLYNKVLGFFKQAEIEENAKEVACNRLRVVLMQDRTNINPALMEKMRKELVELLSKYVEMDKEALELNLEQDGEQMALMLSIPVIRAKDEDEIADCESAEEDIKDSDDVIGEREAEEVEATEDNEEREETSEEAPEEDEKCICSEVECFCIDEKSDKCECTEKEEICDCGKEDCKCGEKLSTVIQEKKQTGNK